MEKPANPQMDSAVQLAIKLLGPSDWHARPLHDLDAVYLWEPVRGGRALIVGADGSVLAASSATSPEAHEREFSKGERTPLGLFGGQFGDEE